MTRLRSLIKEVLSTPPKKKDCNCGCGGCDKKAPIITEGRIKKAISEGLTYHVENKIPLHESVYRIGSEKHFALINEARKLWVRGLIDVSEDDQAILETHLGHFGMYEGEKVPLDLPMVNEETVDWPKVVSSRYGEYKFVLDKVMSDRAKYKVVDVETGKEEPGGRVYGTPSQLQAAADDLIKPSGGRQSSQFEESLNELKKGDKLKLKLKNGKEFEVTFDSYSKTDGIGYMKYIDKDGDPVIKPFSLNSIVSEGFKDYLGYSEPKMPSQEEVDKFFSITQNEMHYLNSKPVMGQKGDRVRSEIEPWDEYDLSNWNALVRKAKAQGKINEGFYSSPSDLEDSGLNVIPKDQIHANKLKDALENSGLYGEWNPREGYFFFPEEEDGYDYLEEKIQELMDDYNIQGYIEGVFEESLDEAEFKGKDVELNKPKRGGSKAYYVYVRDPKTKKIKKVSFGSGGLRAKIKNKEARNAFAARHNCKNKKDRTKAGYWSCNLPRYAKQLGLGSNMNTFW
jgi:hypothetical protein